MTPYRYNELFHRANLNEVAFKKVNDCDDEIRKMVEMAIEEEREECAKVCEAIDVEYEGEDVLATWCAAAIRARGEK